MSAERNEQSEGPPFYLGEIARFLASTCRTRPQDLHLRSYAPCPAHTFDMSGGPKAEPLDVRSMEPLGVTMPGSARLHGGPYDDTNEIGDTVSDDIRG